MAGFDRPRRSSERCYFKREQAASRIVPRLGPYDGRWTCHSDVSGNRLAQRWIYLTMSDRSRSLCLQAFSREGYYSFQRQQYCLNLHMRVKDYDQWRKIFVLGVNSESASSDGE